MVNKKGNILLVILILVGIVSALVGGYFWWYSQKPKNEPVVEIKPKDKIVNTEVIKSTNSGIISTKDYSFNIPTDWIQSNPDNNQEFVFKSDLGEIDFWRQLIEPYGSLQNWFKVGLTTAPGFDKQSYALTETGGHNILKSIKLGQQTIYAISLNNKEALQMTCSYSDQTKCSDIFDQILSTFKFLDQNQPQGSSGIYGMATIEPTCAGPERLGQICSKPYIGTIAVGKQIQNQTKLGGFEEVTRFQTNTDGSFRVSIPAGDYVVKKLDNSVLYGLTKTPIHVEENKFSEVNIMFDTGIR